jgi:hypothetical protein
VFVACGSNGGGGNEQEPPPQGSVNSPENEPPTPPDNRTPRPYEVTVRTTQFVVVTDVKFLFNNQEIESTFSDGIYSFTSKESFPDIVPTKSGYTYHIARNNFHMEKVNVLIIATTAWQNVDINAPFEFAGKMVDDDVFGGETGLAGVKIMVDDIVVFETDSTGNYQIQFLFEDTIFTFVKGNYIFNPPTKLVYETTIGFRVRGSLNA